MGNRKRLSVKRHTELVFIGGGMWKEEEHIKLKGEEEAVAEYLEFAGYEAQIRNYYHERQKREQKKRGLYDKFIALHPDWNNIDITIMKGDDELNPEVYISRLKRYFDKIEKKVEEKQILKWEKECREDFDPYLFNDNDYGFGEGCENEEIGYWNTD